MQELFRQQVMFHSVVHVPDLRDDLDDVQATVYLVYPVLVQELKLVLLLEATGATKTPETR